MASSYKTESLKLTQFEAGDKPGWLTDYNNDMERIDAAFGSAVNEKVDEVLAHLSESIEGIVLYQHEKVGTVHRLANPAGGANIKFVATAPFEEGDSFEVNGMAATTNGSLAFEAGETVLVFYDGNEGTLSCSTNMANFNVISGDDAPPATAAEETIWVAGTFSVVSYCSGRPNRPIVGELWLPSGGDVQVRGKAIRDTLYYIGPPEIYDGTDWQRKQAFIRLGGAWNEIRNGVLFMEGQQFVPWKAGIKGPSTDQAAITSFTQSPGDIYFQVFQGGATYSQPGAITAQAVDVTNYNTLFVHKRKLEITTDGYHRCAVGVWPRNDVYMIDGGGATVTADAFYDPPNTYSTVGTHGEETVQVDISSVTGMKYPGVLCIKGTAGAGKMYVDKIWMV